MFIIKGISNNQECYFVEIYLNEEYNVIVRKVSATIEGATLFDSIEDAEEQCQKINNKSFKIYPVCPKCHKEYYGYPAISRVDNKTKICDKCGLTEALTIFFEHEKKATNM